MKWHALKLEANIMPQIQSNKQHFELCFAIEQYIRLTCFVKPLTIEKGTVFNRNEKQTVFLGE